jgi:hypothetical protein
LTAFSANGKRSTQQRCSKLVPHLKVNDRRGLDFQPK